MNRLVAMVRGRGSRPNSKERQAMKPMCGVFDAIRRRLHIRPDPEEGSVLFWSAEGMLPRPWTAWVDDEELVTDELQFYADHFTAADTASGLTYVTHVVGGSEQ